jgi:hypothetical protein
MATFGEMQTAVSKRLLDANNTAIALSDVAASINDAIRYWKFRRFWFNEDVIAEVLVAQDPDLPLPTDFLVPALKNSGVYIQYSNLRYPLRKISEAQYDGMFLSNGYGLPYYYTRIGDGTWKAYPIPDQAYALGGHYLKDYAALVNNADTNDFTDYANRLITLWTLANMSAEFRQDDKMEAYYRQAANDEYRQLQVMTDKSNSTGTLTNHSIL